LELVHPDGATDPITLDRQSAHALYQGAFAAAKQAGFALSTEPLRLLPQDKLVDIVRKSQELALSGGGDDDDEPGSDK
jgi:CRISPR-associated protein Csb1